MDIGYNTKTLVSYIQINLKMVDKYVHTNVRMHITTDYKPII